VTGFADRYGPWALVAGASEGIGAAFATALARRGVNLVLVARRPEPLAALAASLPVSTVEVRADLSTMDGLAAVRDAVGDREVGLLVCNAAYAPMGPFLEAPESGLENVLDVNCRATVLLARRYLPGMVTRGRGGLVVMSSVAGLQGLPGLSLYAATKAFGAVLAEGLWAELRGTGVDVVACLAGAVVTPGYRQSMAKPAPGAKSPEEVVDAALRALPHGPRTVPGGLMKVSAALMGRLLPRRTAIGIIGRASSGLAAPAAPQPPFST
jgi:short-subunit dehydrogenase